MADVAAVPQEAQQQLQIYFGGQFDQSVMGAPVYFWCMFFLGIMFILSVINLFYILTQKAVVKPTRKELDTGADTDY